MVTCSGLSIGTSWARGPEGGEQNCGRDAHDVVMVDIKDFNTVLEASWYGSSELGDLFNIGDVGGVAG